MGNYGAAALADAFLKHGGDFRPAFQDYDKNFRPYIEKVQMEAVDNLNALIPKATGTDGEGET